MRVHPDHSITRRTGRNQNYQTLRGMRTSRNTLEAHQLKHVSQKIFFFFLMITPDLFSSLFSMIVHNVFQTKLHRYVLSVTLSFRNPKCDILIKWQRAFAKQSSISTLSKKKKMHHASSTIHRALYRLPCRDSTGRCESRACILPQRYGYPMWMNVRAIVCLCLTKC